MKKLSILLILSLVLLLSLGASSYYDKGSQTFKITVGFDYPLTSTFMKNGSFTTVYGSGLGDNNTHFELGGYGSLDYEVFSNSTVSVGGEIGYQFNYAGSYIFTQVPMLAKATFTPIQGKIETPLSLGAGFNYMSYNEASMICPMVEATAGATFFISENWGVGISTGLQATAELYTERKKCGAIGFIPANAVITYRH